jgi:hypothetical protein
LENLSEKIIRVLKGGKKGKGGGFFVFGGLRLDCYGAEETD